MKYNLSSKTWWFFYILISFLKQNNKDLLKYYSNYIFCPSLPPLTIVIFGFVVKTPTCTHRFEQNIFQQISYLRIRHLSCATKWRTLYLRTSSQLYIIFLPITKYLNNLPGGQSTCEEVRIELSTPSLYYARTNVRSKRDQGLQGSLCALPPTMME